MAFMLIDEYPFNAKRNGCIGCGAPRRLGERIVQFDQMVDEIIELDGTIHGAMTVNLCETCIIELGVMMGCLNPDQSTRLRNQVAGLEAKLAETESALGTRDDLNLALMRLTELAGDLRPSDA